MTQPHGRRLVANLDVEEDWAICVEPRRPRPTLPRIARERISVYGTLMRILARSDAGPRDRLWTPLPVDPTRLPADVGPVVDLESGPPAELPTLVCQPWGEAEPWCRPRPVLWESSRTTKVKSPLPAAAVANDRRFGLDLAHDLGVADPLAITVESRLHLLEHLRGPARHVERWVVKGPFSAAGRARVHGSTADLEKVARSTSLRRLFHSHGPLVFEPWLDRELDLGFLFEVGPAGGRTQEGNARVGRIGGSLHRLRVDARGHFLGITLDPNEPWLDEVDRRELERVADSVAESLAKIGYRGPVGLDLWLHRPPTPSAAHAPSSTPNLRLHPLGEINARHTFGHLARAWVEHLSPNGHGTLRLGNPERKDPKADTKILLHPSKPGARDAAFLELEGLGQ